jgi:diacylglycerol kinase family enzyme
VDVGLTGKRHKFDVGHMNGERFAVMAGLGFDANVIRAADKHMKHILGRELNDLVVGGSGTLEDDHDVVALA